MEPDNQARWTREAKDSGPPRWIFSWETTKLRLRLSISCGSEGSETITIVRWQTDNCGNGTVDEFETCDDANREDGDCCSSACRVEPDGSSCDDGTLCTANDSCQAGTCQPGVIGPDSCGNMSLCYDSRTKDRTEAASQIEIEDTLGKETYNLKKASSICVAANVNGQDAVDANSHYLSYRSNLSTPTTSRPTARDFRVTTSLGTLDVTTRGVDRLLISTSIELGSTPAAPARSVADNYKCHRIRSRDRGNAGQGPLLINEFLEDRSYKLRRPTRLCLPATVNGEAPINRDLNFLCYDVRRSRGEPRHQRPSSDLAATNIFSSHDIVTRREARLCLPAQIELLP